ncbi:hypothetical protein [Nonomuraea sp. SBT364]|uniref:hypothetical protein n=1 Tax=Nonomuraea sp. SBT364 TaxID=1580530 RepID=UPI003FA5B9B1
MGAGFRAGADEWWHFDYGNQIWPRTTRDRSPSAARSTPTLPERSRTSTWPSRQSHS